MNKNLANFYRTVGSKDKKPRNNWKKYVPAIASTAATGIIVGGALGANAFIGNRANKANQFIRKVVEKQGFTNSTRGELYNDFIQLPKFSKKMFLDAQEQAERAGRIPTGSTNKIKQQLRRAHIENIGLSDDLNTIRAAKLQARTGEISTQEAFGAKVIQRVRNRAKNKGKTFKGIRKDMRNTLGFSQTTQILATFSRTPGAKDKQKRRSYLGVVGNDAKTGAKIGAALGAVPALGILGLAAGSKVGRQALRQDLQKRGFKSKLAKIGYVAKGAGLVTAGGVGLGAVNGASQGAIVGAIRAPFRPKEVEVAPVDNSIRGRAGRGAAALRSRVNTARSAIRSRLSRTEG